MQNKPPSVKSPYGFFFDDPILDDDERKRIRNVREITWFLEETRGMKPLAGIHQRANFLPPVVPSAQLPI